MVSHNQLAKVKLSLFTMEYQICPSYCGFYHLPFVILLFFFKLTKQCQREREREREHFFRNQNNCNGTVGPKLFSMTAHKPDSEKKLKYFFNAIVVQIDQLYSLYMYTMKLQQIKFEDSNKYICELFHFIIHKIMSGTLFGPMQDQDS